MKKSVFAAFIVLVLVLAYCVLTVIYFPPRRDNLLSDLASVRYLLTFSVLGLLSPLVILFVRKQNNSSKPELLQTFIMSICCVSMGLSLLVMLGAFRVLTCCISDRLVPFRTALLILIPVASLIVAFVTDAKGKPHRIQTGLYNGLAVATVFTVVATLGMRFNSVQECVRTDFDVFEENRYIGYKASDIPLYSLDQAPRTLSSYEGRIVVVNFWAPWCGHCRPPIPTLLEFFHAYPADKVVFLPISIDSLQQRAETNASWIRISPLISQLKGENVAVWTDTAQLRTWSPFPLSSLYLLDKRGVIRWSMNGWAMDERMINLYNTFLLRLKEEIRKVQADEAI